MNMKIVAKLMIGLLTLSVSVCLGQTLRKAEDYYQRGLVRYEKGDVEGAIADYSKAIEMYPKYASAYNSRAAARKTKGDIDGAIADYNKAIELSPEIALPYYYRGFIFLEKQDFD